MVIVVTTIGASHAYPNRDRLKATINAFMGSLRRQTSKDFHLFMTGHDYFGCLQEDWIHWISASGDGNFQSTLVHERFPVRVYEELHFTTKGVRF